MEPMHHHNDEAYRLKREEPAAFSAHMFIHWWLIPGFIGIITAVFLGKFVTGMATAITANQPLGRTADRIIKEMNEDFTHLIMLEWGQTNVWMFILFGFLAGVLIKYVYSDENIR